MSYKESKNHQDEKRRLDLPADLREEIIQATEEITSKLRQRGWQGWPRAKITSLGKVSGEAMAEASSILGIEKYLGMIDDKERIAYFPSVKLTNDSTVTRSYLKFSPEIKEDIVFIAGKKADGREKERVINVVNRFREVTGITSGVFVVSENFFKGGTTGKGLGTSAAAGAALAAASVQAAAPGWMRDDGFVQSIARIMAGSAPQSIAGGFSVWLSGPSFINDPYQSFSVRVDNGKIPVRLVVVPIEKSTKTEEAHQAAVKSPHYLDWCRKKVKAVPDLIDAIIEGSLPRIGEHAEDDSVWLNKVITSGGGVNNWEPDTETIRQKVVELRKKGLVSYYSMDTGPSVAVLTSSQDAEEVKRELESVLDGKYKGRVFLADLTGGPRILPLEKRNELLTGEMWEELERNK